MLAILFNTNYRCCFVRFPRSQIDLIIDLVHRFEANKRFISVVGHITHLLAGFSTRIPHR